MDYAALEKSLQRQVISPVYLFYGEETYLRDGILDKFKALVPGEVRDFNMDIVDNKDTGLEAIVGMAMTMPFMSEKRLVIVKNAGFFKAKRKNRGDGSEEGNEKEEKTDNTEKSLLSYLEEPVNSTCLIFCTDSIDKKRKIYKAIEKQGQVVEFSPLKGRDLNEWIDRRARNLGKIIEPKAMAGLITAVGSDLQHLSTEMEKLACYSRTERITAADVTQMVSKTAELSVFELVDAVGDRNYEKAIKMAREMVFLGEPVIKLLFMVARQFRLILRSKDLYQKGYAEKQVAGQLQVHPYVAQKCIRQAKNFTMDELILALEKILKADSDIKNGRQDPMLALELLIINLNQR